MTGPRSVVVTGGTRGLGATLVESFLDAGDRVASCGRRASARVDGWSADKSLGERFYFEELDLADRAAAERFVAQTMDRFGRIDVLVNNAGIAYAEVLGLTSDADIDRVVDVNLKATIFLTKLVVRHMLRQGSGRVVNVSSIVGLEGYSGLSVYGATKAALDGFTRALARELGPRQITVNSVAPGYLRTEMSDELSEAQLEQITRRTPLGRLGDPADIAAAVQFLVSPQARFITGHVLVVDGGLTA